LRNALQRLDLHDGEGVARALAELEAEFPAGKEAVLIRFLLACLDAQHRQSTQQIAGALALSRQLLGDLVRAHARPDDTQFG
jgi:hypothetical protein